MSAGLRAALTYRDEVMFYRRRRALCAVGALVAAIVWVGSAAPMFHAVTYWLLIAAAWNSGAVYAARRTWVIR